MTDQMSARLGELFRIRRQELGITTDQHVERINRRLKRLDPHCSPLNTQKLYRRESGIASFKWAEVVAAFEALDLRMLFLADGHRPLPPERQVHSGAEAPTGKRASLLASLLLEHLHELEAGENEPS